MTAYFTNKTKDLSESQIVKTDIDLFPFIKELTNKQRFIEYEYNPIINKSDRELICSLHQKSKHIKHLLQHIDFLYFNKIQWRFIDLKKESIEYSDTKSLYESQIKKYSAIVIDDKIKLLALC